jgi:hypothetical protein
LCLPIVKQGGLIALLYLENNSAAGVFTPARITFIKLLASVASVALENSRGIVVQVGKLVAPPHKHGVAGAEHDVD